MLTNAVAQGAPFAHAYAFIQMSETHFSFNSVSMNYYDVFWHTGEGELFLMWNNWEGKKTPCCLQDLCHQLATAELGIVPLISWNSLEEWICAFTLHFWMCWQCSQGGDSDPPLLRYPCPQKILLHYFLNSRAQPVRHRRDDDYVNRAGRN